MISFFILLVFFLYTFLLFLVHDFLFLFYLWLVQWILSFCLKISFQKHFVFYKKNISFVLFIFLCNLFFSNISTAFIVSVHLFLAIDYSYIMSYYFNPQNISNAFYYFFYPLKYFKVEIHQLTLITSIAFTFIPILLDELNLIKTSLRIKGFRFHLISFLFQSHTLFILLLNNLFERLDELEKSLLIKAY